LDKCPFFVVIVVVAELVVVVVVAHNGSVLTVKLDALTQLAITAGADSFLRFWKFKSRELINELKMDAAIAKATVHRDRLLLLHRVPKLAAPYR